MYSTKNTYNILLKINTSFKKLVFLRVYIMFFLLLMVLHKCVQKESRQSWL